VRQAGNQVNIDVADAGFAQAGNVMVDFFTAMQPANRSSFLIYELLHAQTHPIHSARDHRLYDFVCQRSGRALHGDFRFGKDFELLSQGEEEFFQFVGRKQAGRSSAKVNRVHRFGYFCVTFLRKRTNRRHIGR
jgi:hypothetical protein